MTKWQPLHSAFPGDTAQVLKYLLPNTLVNATAVANAPTHDDPLGAKSKLTVTYRPSLSGAPRLQFKVFDRHTPELEPEAMEVYLYVEWPEIFRRAT